MPLDINESQYEDLLALALKADPVTTRALRAEVDKINGITRYGLLVRWQDLGGQAPPRREIAKPWPPEATQYIEMKRRITRADVDAVLEKRAINPVDVQVTPDPEGRVGWSQLSAFDFEAA